MPSHLTLRCRIGQLASPNLLGTLFIAIAVMTIPAGSTSAQESASSRAGVLVSPFIGGESEPQQYVEGVEERLGQPATIYRNEVSVLVGQFAYNYGDGKAPYASVRAVRELNRFFEAEAGVGYARTATRLYSFTPTITEYLAHTPFVSGDLALHAKLPFRKFAPYVGVSTGAFRRGSDDAFQLEGRSGTSVGVLTGARAGFTDRIALRGELRVRGDTHSGSDHMSSDAEWNLGLGYRF